MDWTEYMAELLVLILAFTVHLLSTVRSIIPDIPVTPASVNILRIRVTERGPRC
jgi:hypothetical protein